MDANVLLSKLSDHSRSILSNITQPSCYLIMDGYQVLNLRYLDFTEAGFKYGSQSFVICENEVFIFKYETVGLEKLENGFHDIHALISPKHELNKQILESILDEVDSLEDFLYDRRIPRHFMDVWFKLKSNVSKLERYYQRNLPVLREFTKKKAKVENFPVNEFQDLEGHIVFNMGQVTAHLSRLDGLHHYYESIKDDNLNKNIYFLTLISAVFLPLNLVVGFFGINTEGLFFKDDPMGTKNVIIILGITLVVTVLGMRIIRFIDHYILRFILSRYNLYNNLSGRLKDFLKVK